MIETEGQQVTTQETGRCEKAAHEVTHASWNHRIHESVFQMATAATIDRIAADVASIKAKVDAVSPEDVRHFVEAEKAWVALVTEQRDSAIRERDEARGKVERLRAELAARPAGWLTDRERRAVAYFAEVCRDDLVPDEWTDSAGVLRSILARAGSPPVVEVPEQKPGLGHLLHRIYRDALDKAGVKWKEVGRE